MREGIAKLEKIINEKLGDCSKNMEYTNSEYYKGYTVSLLYIEQELKCLKEKITY